MRLAVDYFFGDDAVLGYLGLAIAEVYFTLDKYSDKAEDVLE